MDGPYGYQHQQRHSPNWRSKASQAKPAVGTSLQRATRGKEARVLPVSCLPPRETGTEQAQFVRVELPAPPCTEKGTPAFVRAVIGCDFVMKEWVMDDGVALMLSPPALSHSLDL